MSKVLIHVKTNRRPISEEVIGFRLEAAVPNMAGRKMKARKNGDSVSFYATQEPAPSFRGSYQVAVGSDFNDITPDILERFKRDLKWDGYTEFELVGNYLGEPFAEMMMLNQAQ